MALGSYSAGHFKSAHLFTLGHPTTGAEPGCHTWYAIPVPGHQAWLTVHTPATDGWDDPTLEPAVWVNVATPNSETWVPETTTGGDWDDNQLGLLTVVKHPRVTPLYPLYARDSGEMGDIAILSASCLSALKVINDYDGTGGDAGTGLDIQSAICRVVLRVHDQVTVDSNGDAGTDIDVLSASCIPVLRTHDQPFEDGGNAGVNLSVLSASCVPVLIVHDQVTGEGGGDMLTQLLIYDAELLSV